MNRDEIINKDKQRRSAERELKLGISATRTYLQPRAIGQRILQSQKQKFTTRTEIAGRFASDNMRWIVAGGLLTLLISARLPISKRLNWLRGRTANK